MKLLKLVLNVAFMLSFTLGIRITHGGSNLPPTQGTSRDGAYFPGVYQYSYHPDQVKRAMASAGFSSIRLAINVESAHDPQTLQRHKSYIDALGGRGIICMFDTSLKPGTSTPRTGRITGKVNEVAQAWQNVHKVFRSYGGNVLYELFNEPWGYHTNADEYLTDMMSVIRIADLPVERVILDGLHGAADVQSVAQAGWSGYLGYHFYNFWLPAGQRTQKAFSQKLQEALAGLSSRVFITEFGANFDGIVADVDQDELRQDVARHSNFETIVSDWQNEYPRKTLRSICDKHPGNKWCQTRSTYPNVASLIQNTTSGGNATLAPLEAPLMTNETAQVLKVMDKDGDGQVSEKEWLDATADSEGTHAVNKPEIYQNETIAFLRGLREGLHELKKHGSPVRGLYHWHGWHNGDSWDFWDAKNARSSRMVQMIMADLREGSTAKDADPFLSEDYVLDEQHVHMLRVLDLEPEKSADCPAECAAPTCQPGNHLEVGGKLLTDKVCTHNCSIPYNGIRYCGAGKLYQGAGVIQCGACAHPAMCAGLPCWSADQKSDPALLQQSKLALRTRKIQKH